ncbi:MAG: hypothetical protein ACQEUT_18375 [Bacillota bacterium]
MAREKLPHASNWMERPLDKWNVTTFHSWFAEMCESRYGVEKYIPFRNWSAEKGMLKRLIAEHGNVVVKEFLEVCLKTYKANGQYLHLTIGFAISYMQSPHLLKILAKHKHPVQSKAAASPQDISNLEDWF